MTAPVAPMEARIVCPWEMRLAEAMQEVQRDPSKRTLLEISGLKAKALAAEIADWRALAAAPVAPQPEPRQPAPELREVLRESLASGLNGYMRECDLYPASDCGDLLDELCDLAIAVLGAPQPALPKLPSTPEEVEAFIAHHFISKWHSEPLEDTFYKLSIHDLLSCFQNLADFAEGQPAQPEEIDFLAMEFPRSTLKAEDWDPATKQPRKPAVVVALPAQQVEAVGQVPYGWLTGNSSDHRQGTLQDLTSNYDFALAECAEYNRDADDLDHVDRVPVPLYTSSQLEAQQAGDVWKPIETAPRGANRISFMTLAWGQKGDQSIGQGIRIDDDFYAAGVFYQLGNKGRPFELREQKVTPTHWKPNPLTPDEEQA